MDIFTAASIPTGFFLSCNPERIFLLEHDRTTYPSVLLEHSFRTSRIQIFRYSASSTTQAQGADRIGVDLLRRLPRPAQPALSGRTKHARGMRKTPPKKGSVDNRRTHPVWTTEVPSMSTMDLDDGRDGCEKGGESQCETKPGRVWSHPVGTPWRLRSGRITGIGLDPSTRRALSSKHRWSERQNAQRNKPSQLPSC